MIISSIVTIVLGFIYFVFLPVTPYSRWFRLSGREMEIVEQRVCDNAVANKKINYFQIWEAL